MLPGSAVGPSGENVINPDSDPDELIRRSPPALVSPLTLAFRILNGRPAESIFARIRSVKRAV